MRNNLEGKKIPEVTFRTRDGHRWADVTSSDIFADKTVVVFSLPGAFTPTCSSSHVPRYNQLASAFKQHGVDQIVCVSVNDAFVMNEWQASQQAENITFLPDGNAEFTEAMGMLVDKSELGFGKRSWRYSMLVRDGVIEKMFIEPQNPGDPYGESDADTLFEYLAPNSQKPLNVTLLARDGCSFCAKAKDLLNDAGIVFEELTLNRDYSDRSLRALSGRTTFPQVFIDGEHIGGADDLEDWLGQREAA